MHWGEVRDISERPLGDLPNHKHTGPANQSEPLRISERFLLII